MQDFVSFLQKFPGGGPPHPPSNTAFGRTHLRSYHFQNPSYAPVRSTMSLSVSDVQPKMRSAELRNALASRNYLDPTGTKPTPRTRLLELKLAPDYCTRGLGRSGSGAEPSRGNCSPIPGLGDFSREEVRAALGTRAAAPAVPTTHTPAPPIQAPAIRATFVRRGSSPTHGRALCLLWLSPWPPQPPQVRKPFMLRCRNPFMIR